MLAAGTQLGPYKILAPLGSGGMGDVYRARDLRLGREVAVKVLSERIARNRQAFGRFVREAKALAALSHAHVLTVYDFSPEPDLAYLVTELLSGESLRSRLGRSELPSGEAVRVGVAVAEGLAVAHARGIIHRDLKPENLFLTADGGVKILDFGLARLEETGSEDPQSLYTMPTAETEIGVLMGTVGYMSPEQVRGEMVDARSDLFSLGCVLYEMVSGKRPFARSKPGETLAAILSAAPPPLSGVQAALEQVIRRCLQKEPACRYASASDLAEALRLVEKGVGGRLGMLGRVAGFFARILAPRPPEPAQTALPSTSPPAPLSGTERGQGERLISDRPIDSLAVLPLVNAGADPDMEFLSDGITESIINQLSRLRRLRVMSRNSVFRFKGKEIDAREVGRALGVQGVLSGRVISRGDSLAVSVELVNVRNDSQVWGERYNRKLADLLAVLEEIAGDVVQQLQLRLSGSDQRRLGDLLGKRHTDNVEAYQLYLKGRYYLNRRTDESMKKSIELFQQALEKDPAYALPYVGLADTYLNLGGWGQLPPREAYPKAKAAAARALELDNSLAGAHTSLAMAAKEYDWDFAGAEQSYRRALELDVNYPVAHMWYGECLAAVGRHPEAIAEFKRALELDPLSLIASATLGRHGYFFARQYDQAVEQCLKTIEMDPHFWVAHHFLGGVYAAMDRLPEAIAASTRARMLEPNLEITALLGHAYGKAGLRTEAEQALDELADVSRKRYVAPIIFALIHIGLGETDEALAWLEKAYEHRTQWLSEINVDPAFDSLRTDGRFQDLLRRIGFSPSTRG